jgi:hypothetical protein
MDHNGLNTYLNDHLAGATLGCDHARQLEEMSADTPFGPTMTRLATEIEGQIDWRTARVVDAVLTVKLIGVPSSEWVQRVEGVIELPTSSQSTPRNPLPIPSRHETAR